MNPYHQHSKMPPKGESVQTYLPPEIKRKLEEWAQEEQRSISFLVAQILMDAIATRNAQQNETPTVSSAKGRGKQVKVDE